jgi:hypothetical protein
MKRSGSEYILWGWLTFHIIMCFSSCTGIIKSYDPIKKFPPQELKRDLDILREVLERFHPSLYAFTSKEEMDHSFDYHRSLLKDSMTEQQFGFHVVAPAISKIRCGHTTMSLSRNYTEFFKGVRMPSFPLYMKIWQDTMIVTRNLNPQDSILKKGTQISSVNGMGPERLAEIMFRYFPTDGYSNTINYIRLSNSFPFYHRNIFGLNNEYIVEYIDSSGEHGIRKLPFYNPEEDTLKSIRATTTTHNVGRNKKYNRDRPSMYLDSFKNTAFLDLPSFEGSKSKKSFYRRSFRKIRKEGIQNLVIDLRNNGGGNVDNQATLARYLKNNSFRVTDTAMAIRRNFGKYSRYFRNDVGNWIAMQILCSRKEDGNYHLRYWENHTFRPFVRNFFSGDLYLIIGGPTFSAASLFCNTLKGQKNITLIGEETGGGQYSNNGLLLPSVVLPNTGVRIRLPLFRMVPDKNAHPTGRGVMPDIYVGPTAESVRNGLDLKMEKAKELISGHLTRKGS